MTAILEPTARAASRVYLLLQTDPGRASEARDVLLATPGVVDVSTTSGPFDLIVHAEVDGAAGLDRLVGRCRRAPGLVRLHRCQAVRAS